MIILDIDMSVMNGKDACIQILKHYREVTKNQQPEERKDLEINSEHAGPKDNGMPVIPHIYAVTGDLFSNDVSELKKIGFRAVCKYSFFMQALRALS